MCDEDLCDASDIKVFHVVFRLPSARALRLIFRRVSKGPVRRRTSAEISY